MKKINLFASFLILVSFVLMGNCNATKTDTGIAKMKQLTVSGNKFVDETGATVVLAGVNFSDPDKLEKVGKWNKQYFEEAKKWGAKVVRFPVHPRAWRMRGQDQYLKLLDDGVKLAEELGLYIIIDWHSIGNLITEKFQHEQYVTTKQETLEFWNIISKRYNNNPTVAFLELFNEPTISGDQFGTMTWDEWKTFNEKMIAVIRANNTKAIVLVAGFDWAYDLTPIAAAPINDKNVAYVTHPYPQKREAPWEEKWEKDYGYVADTYPVFATELGFMDAKDKGAHIPTIADETYGRTIISYFDKKGISWVAWVFDPEWVPSMFTDWNYTPTRQGAFFRDAMLEK